MATKIDKRETRRKERDENKETFNHKPLQDALGNLDLAGEQIGLDTIYATLELPNNEFNLLKDLLLEELEKSLNNVEDKLLIVQSLNASGLKVEDFAKSFEDIIKNLDEKLKGVYPQIKIDFLKRFFGLIVEAISSTEGIAKRMIPVAFEIIEEGAKQPKYMHAGDAGMDVFSIEDVEIKPGETKLVRTGIRVALPLGYEFQMRPRSGHSLKTKLRVANAPGTIDANYRGEIAVILENIEPMIKNVEFIPVFKQGTGEIVEHKVGAVEYGQSYFIEKGERIAQLVLSEKPTCVFYQVEDVGEIGEDRGGGFGSSGKK